MTTIISGISMLVSDAAPQTMKAEAASFDTGSRIRVDINKNDGRKASYSKNAKTGCSKKVLLTRIM